MEEEAALLKIVEESNLKIKKAKSKLKEISKKKVVEKLKLYQEKITNKNVKESANSTQITNGIDIISCSIQTQTNVKLYCKEKPEPCSICTELLQNNLATLKKCKHVFHKKCIQNWFNQNVSQVRKCPLCREIFTKTNILDTSVPFKQVN